jgi:hypothetical protein
MTSSGCVISNYGMWIRLHKLGKNLSFQSRLRDAHKDQCCKAMYNRSKIEMKTYPVNVWYVRVMMAIQLCEFTDLRKSQNTYWMQSSLPAACSKCAEQQNNRLMLQYTQRHWPPGYYLQDTINSSGHWNNSSTVLGVQHQNFILQFIIILHVSV